MHSLYFTMSKQISSYHFYKKLHWRITYETMKFYKNGLFVKNSLFITLFISITNSIKKLFKFIGLKTSLYIATVKGL